MRGRGELTGLPLRRVRPTLPRRRDLTTWHLHRRSGLTAMARRRELPAGHVLRADLAWLALWNGLADWCVRRVLTGWRGHRRAGLTRLAVRRGVLLAWAWWRCGHRGRGSELAGRLLERHAGYLRRRELAGLLTRRTVLAR